MLKKYNKIKLFFVNGYYRKSIFLNLVLLTVSSCFYSLAQVVFLTKAHVFPTGLSSIAQLLIYVVPSLPNDLFAVIYLALNVPLLIFVLLKYPRRNFVYYTTYFIILLMGWGLLFNNIPYFVDFNPFSVDLNNPTMGWAVFVYASIAGLLIAIAVSLAFSASGSSGGTDLPVVYISYKTGRSIGAVSRTLSLLLVFIAIFSKTLSDNESIVDGFTNQFAIGSYVFIFIYTAVLNRVYPKYRKVKLSISVENPKLVIEVLESLGYYHSYTIFEVTSGYTKKRRYQVETIMFFFEQRQIIESIQKKDPNAWFAISRIERTIGRFIRRD